VPNYAAPPYGNSGYAARNYGPSGYAAPRVAGYPAAPPDYAVPQVRQYPLPPQRARPGGGTGGLY
jgi:hypothetical protein